MGLLCGRTRRLTALFGGFRPAQEWPGFDITLCWDAAAFCPQEKAVQTMRLALHAELNNMLTRELQRRAPGFIVKFDGTFRVAGRMKTAKPLTTETGKVRSL